MEPVERSGGPDAAEIMKTKWVEARGAARLLSYPSDLRLIERYNGRQTAR